MSYYWFNRKEILQKAKERYSKKKLLSIIHKTWKQWKKSQKNDTKTCQKKKKTRLKSTKEKLIQYKKEALQNKWALFLLSIRMSEKTLKFDNVRVNKKEFHKSKQSIDLNLVNIDQRVVSDKFRHNDDGVKHFIGYKRGEIVKPLCIILP